MVGPRTDAKSMVQDSSPALNNRSTDEQRTAYKTGYYAIQEFYVAQINFHNSIKLFYDSISKLLDTKKVIKDSEKEKLKLFLDPYKALCFNPFIIPDQKTFESEMATLVDVKNGTREPDLKKLQDRINQVAFVTNIASKDAKNVNVKFRDDTLNNIMKAIQLQRQFEIFFQGLSFDENTNTKIKEIIKSSGIHDLFSSHVIKPAQKIGHYGLLLSAINVAVKKDLSQLSLDNLNSSLEMLVAFTSKRYNSNYMDKSSPTSSSTATTSSTTTATSSPTIASSFTSTASSLSTSSFGNSPTAANSTAYITFTSSLGNGPTAVSPVSDTVVNDSKHKTAILKIPVNDDQIKNCLVDIEKILNNFKSVRAELLRFYKQKDSNDERRNAAFQLRMELKEQIATIEKKQISLMMATDDVPKEAPMIELLKTSIGAISKMTIEFNAVASKFYNIESDALDQKRKSIVGTMSEMTNNDKSSFKTLLSEYSKYEKAAYMELEKYISVKRYRVYAVDSRLLNPDEKLLIALEGAFKQFKFNNAPSVGLFSTKADKQKLKHQEELLTALVSELRQLKLPEGSDRKQMVNTDFQDKIRIVWLKHYVKIYVEGRTKSLGSTNKDILLETVEDVCVKQSRALLHEYLLIPNSIDDSKASVDEKILSSANHIVDENKLKKLISSFFTDALQAYLNGNQMFFTNYLKAITRMGSNSHKLWNAEIHNLVTTNPQLKVFDNLKVSKPDLSEKEINNIYKILNNNIERDKLSKHLLQLVASDKAKPKGP